MESNFFSHIWHRVKNGLIIFRYSFLTMKKSPYLWLFLIFNTILVSSIIILTLGAIYGIIGIEQLREFLDLFDKKTQSTPHFIDYFIISIGILTIYFVSFFISSLMAVATASCVQNILEGRSCYLFNSLAHSLKRTPTLALWSITATFLFIFFHEKSNKPGSIFGDLVIFGWRLLSFFIAPVLALENLNLYHSMKQSALTMQKTFGETALIVVGIRWIRFLAMTLAIFLSIGSLWIISYLIGILFGPELQLPTSTIFFIVAYIIISMIFALSLITTLTIIFKTAVYSYVSGRPTGLFPAQLIKTGFTQEK